MRLLDYFFAVRGGGSHAVNPLEVPLFSISLEGVDIKREAPPEAVRPKGVADFPLGPVQVDGMLSGADQEFLFRGRVSSTHMATCDRCLEPVEVPIDIEVVWVFVQGAVHHPIEELAEQPDEQAEDDSGMITFEGAVIDLAPATWEEIALAIPAKILCRVDCAGLCPVCGVNRNHTQCTCDAGDRREAPRFGHSGLKALGEMFPHLPSHRTED